MVKEGEKGQCRRPGIKEPKKRTTSLPGPGCRVSFLYTLLCHFLHPAGTVSRTDDRFTYADVHPTPLQKIMLLCQEKKKKKKMLTFIPCIPCIATVICHGSSSFINLILYVSTRNSNGSRNNKEKSAPPHSSRSAAYAALEATLELQQSVFPTEKAKH